jgi:predicted AlkP superfamily pyrophosphatase or phosphodiesterase
MAGRAAFLGLLLVFFIGCRPTQEPSDPDAHPPSPLESTLILISLDGFMPSYAERHATPNLDAVAREGVRARALKPVFPTKTFPNHYTIVTGLYPARHGIISNNIYDPLIDSRFSLSNRDAVGDSRWWGGEPIWVTAEKQGLITATMFWPGSEAAIGGVRPTYWFEYDGALPNEDRVDQALAWLELPPQERPRFITLYFSDVDTRGHRHGPESREVADAVAHVDSLIGRLLDGLAAQGIEDDVNLMIVSDHGMASTSRDRVVILDDFLDPEDLRIIDLSPVLMAEPVGVSIAEAIDALRRSPHLDVYHRDSVPPQWHFAGNHRIPSLIAVAEEGRSIASRRQFERNRDRFDGGAHGYPPEVRAMDALFIASGPSFARGVEVEPFSNVHLYNVMAAVLGIIPANNDGDFEIMKPYLNFDSLPLVTTR